jgi:hypothetical protein
MTSYQLKDLAAELDRVQLLSNDALLELRSILSAIIEHLYFNEFYKENDHD